MLAHHFATAIESTCVPAAPPAEPTAEAAAPTEAEAATSSAAVHPQPAEKVEIRAPWHMTEEQLKAEAGAAPTFAKPAAAT